MSSSPLPAGFALHDKVTFITGANAGIGRGIAERLAEHGSQLVLFDRDQSVMAAAEQLQQGTRRALGVVGDVSHTPDVKAAALEWGKYGITAIQFHRYRRLNPFT
jgi:NAD(P)-dependent dehydrogenase (short-subunit alcohol dehydrogenase family)